MTAGRAESADLRRWFVDGLSRGGKVTDADLLRAFATVPREVFVADGFLGRDGRRVGPDDRGFLAAVYRDDVLVTKVVGGTPVSSSSQPSLMAAMIEAVGPRTGLRVLEIGAGTGYNAALLAATGCRVTSVDVQPDVVARARAAVDRVAPVLTAGAGRVEVRLGDGYLGAPEDAPYDRVIVTVGVNGLSPHWLDQLAPGGIAVVPVGHAGNHPVLRVGRPADGQVRAAAIFPAGFMSAAGVLSASYPGVHPPPPRQPLAAPTVRRRPRWRRGLGSYRYHDLWFAAGVWNRRITYAALRDSPGPGGCALLDEDGGGGALLGTDGSILATGARDRWCAQRLSDLLDRWVRLGAPAIGGWSATLRPAGDPDQPILVPYEWVSRALTG
nr:methyltransferase domain-containing protein [Micromonospora sp. DSM 115978]